MKLKQDPDDFQVEELTDVNPAPGSNGPYAFYRLEKRGWTTPDALSLLRRRWKLSPQRLSHGGLKDRHAATIQYLTVFRGPRRNFEQQGVRVEYVGQTAKAYSSHDIRANRFRVVIRDGKEVEMASALGALEQVRHHGLPNYFDDQRFGSVHAGGEFIARLLIDERYEDALRLALMAPYEYDRAEQKKEKAILSEHWGNWGVCKEQLPRGHARSLVDYLRVHPGDFRGALERLRPELGGLYLSAYQSWLWNRTLALAIKQLCQPEQQTSLDLRLGELPFHTTLNEDQQQQLGSLTLPLASARLKLEPGDPRGRLLESVLAEDGLKLEHMKLRKIRSLFFSRGERPALCLPRELKGIVCPDERHRDRQKLTMEFELPRGSYATLLVKRVGCLRPGLSS